MDNNVYAHESTTISYSIDHVLTETHSIIENLKTQLEVESGRLNHIESALADTNNYAAPAWFNE